MERRTSDKQMLVLRFINDYIKSNNCAPTTKEIAKDGQMGSMELKIHKGNLSLALAEETLIKKAIERTGGNQVQAAKLLDITRHALRYRIEKYGI